MEGGGTERSLVVRRFINAWPGVACARARADASLTNTYWRLVRLDGEPVHAVEGRREPHLLLKKDEPRAARATVGCNQLTGGYTVAGETLTFTDPASTRMACPPPLDALERSLGEMLVKTRSWRIKGPTLELSDESGATLALLEAVFF
jgi:heat shock protein HslJ